MKQLSINYLALVNTIIFSLIYGLAFLVFKTFFVTTAAFIIFSIMSLIIYVNILRKFILEVLCLEETRFSEFFIYFLMYLITALVIILPFFSESEIVLESKVLRNMIIVFASILLTKYTIYMFLGPWHDLKTKIIHKRHFDNVEYNPLVSVMIPAWNEGVGVLGTVESIMQSSYRNVEIVLVNDGSTDNSDQKIREYLEEYAKTPDRDIAIQYVYQQNTGKGGALNRAVSQARGEILLSIDADCVVDKDAIKEFVEVFKDPEVYASVGNVKIGNKDNSVGIIQFLEFLFSFYFKRADAMLGSIYIIGGAAGAFRREIFEKLGGYSEGNITEDIELSVRIQDLGLKIEYASKALVYTEGASDIQSLKKQRLRWKKGRFQTFYQYKHMFFSRNPRHNKILTWIIMPLSMVQEVSLLLEIPFVILLFVLSMTNSDFTSYMSGILVVGMMFVVQMLFYEKSVRKISFLLLAPIGWMLFYVTTYVEVYALIKSIESFVFKKEVTWQRWERKGVGVKVQ